MSLDSSSTLVDRYGGTGSYVSPGLLLVVVAVVDQNIGLGGGKLRRQLTLSSISRSSDSTLFTSWGALEYRVCLMLDSSIQINMYC